MKEALILINLGAPEKATSEAASAFLLEFLSDPEVISLNFIFRRAIAHIAAFRRGKAYAERLGRIFDGGAHPLRKHTESLAGKVAARLEGVGVHFAYRYGSPSIGEVIGRARAQGAKKFCFIALFPQNASSTTQSAKSEVLRNMRPGEIFDFVQSYCDHPAYVSALADSIRAAGATECGALVASFHSVPLKHLAKTPYEAECLKTVELLEKASGMGPIKIAWQSKFGRGGWLGPGTAEVCDSLLASGVKTLAVICPGFSADCGETLTEIGSDLRDRFIAGGGERFILVPCLNDSDSHAEMVCQIFKGRR